MKNHTLVHENNKAKSQTVVCLSFNVIDVMKNNIVKVGLLIPSFTSDTTVPLSCLICRPQLTLNSGSAVTNSTKSGGEN